MNVFSQSVFRLPQWPQLIKRHSYFYTMIIWSHKQGENWRWVSVFSFIYHFYFVYILSPFVPSSCLCSMSICMDGQTCQGIKRKERKHRKNAPTYHFTRGRCYDKWLKLYQGMLGNNGFCCADSEVRRIQNEQIRTSPWEHN